MFACLNRKISADEKVVFRDELTKKKSPPPSGKEVKKSVRFAESDPTIMGEDLLKGSCSGNKLGEREGLRVKVKMTKKEAARLLSKCKEGGVLEFKDVARELAALPVNRVSIVTLSSNDSVKVCGS